MIVGVLNPEKMWHQKLGHLPTLRVFCSHCTLENPKSHLSKVGLLFIHTSKYLRCLRRKQTVTPLPTTPKMSPYYPVKCTNFHLFHFFHAYRVPIRDTDELRHGLNFSTAWWTMQLISGEKDWKHVSVQKLATLNICCNVVACLTFHLPHITTGSFQSR